MANEARRHKLTFSMAQKFLHSLVRVLIQSQGLCGPADGVGWGLHMGRHVGGSSWCQEGWVGTLDSNQRNSLEVAVGEEKPSLLKDVKFWQPLYKDDKKRPNSEMIKSLLNTVLGDTVWGLLQGDSGPPAMSNSWQWFPSPGPGEGSLVEKGYTTYLRDFG